MPLPGEVHFSYKKSLIERRIVSDAGVLTKKRAQTRHHRLGPWFAPNHGVGNSRQAGDERWNVHARIHQLRKRGGDSVVADHDGGNLNDAIRSRAQASGFEIDDGDGDHEDIRSAVWNRTIEK